jgi:hypothetical protein
VSDVLLKVPLHEHRATGETAPANHLPGPCDTIVTEFRAAKTLEEYGGR